MTAAPGIAHPGTAGDRPSRPPLRDPQFLRYLGGQSISQIGDQFWFVALSWTAVHLGSAGTAGVLLTLSSLPRLALLLFGGVIADRFDIRRLMIGSDIARTLVTLAAAAIALTGPGIPMLAVLALSFGLVDALFMPAAGAMQPRLLHPDQYRPAAVLANMATRLALSVGAPLGGLLVAYGGVPLALAVDAGTFAISVVTLASVRPRPLPAASAAHRTDYWADFRSGIVFLARHPVLGPLTLATLLTNVGFVGPMNIGLAELSTHRGWGAAGIGLMLTGFGLGATAGALLMARLRPRRAGGVWLTVVGTVQGVAVFSTALAPSVGYAVAGTAVAGLCSGPMAVIASVLNQAQTPDAFRGRVTATTTLVNLGIVPLASAATGFVIAALGVTGAYAVCALVEACALLTLLAPGFRAATVQR